MRFLLLNRYDPLNRKAGGAELFGIELAKRLVNEGHEVTWFSSKDEDVHQDQVEGVKIIRKGNVLSVIFHAFLYYRNNSNKIDYVIDEIHAYPFLTIFYVPKKKRLVLVHEVAEKIWFYICSKPIGFVGYILEKIMYRFFYHDEFTFTVSESSKADLIRYGVNQSNIKLLSQGLKKEGVSKSEYTKSESPTIVYLGGLRPLKRVEDQIYAINKLIGGYPDLRFYILGRNTGGYADSLQRLAKELEVDKNIIFTGYLSEEDKIKLLKKSWLTLNTSVKEGWGIAVSEAGLYRVPAVVYKTQGNTDAVIDNKTGIHTLQNDPKSLANSIRQIISDRGLREHLGANAQEFAMKLDWDTTKNKFLNGISEFERNER